MRLTVIGAGSWGTALAARFAERHDTLLYGRDAGLMAALRQTGENSRYLPGIQLPEALSFSAALSEALEHVLPADNASAPALLLLAVPVSALESTLRALLSARPAWANWPANLNLIWVCKGFEADSGRLPHRIVDACLNAGAAASAALPYGVLSGPSFAREVARDQPCALTIASPHAGVRALGLEALHSGSLRIYASNDMLGVEVAAAVKNVIAIACGVSDGLGLGLNARAALITRGLAEITRLGVAMGACADTFVGLSGLGDLVLTATGDLSRNRRVGLGLAAGQRLDDILSELGQVAEGVRCACATAALASAHGVDMPITQAVCAVLFEGLAPRTAVDHLIAREPRHESPLASLPG